MSTNHKRSEFMAPPSINKQVAQLAKANRLQDRPAVFADAYGAAWFTIEETNYIIGALNKPVFDLDMETAEVVFLMHFNCLSDIMAAVYVLHSGWVRPCVISLRGALETLATAIAIHHDPQLMGKFREHKLNIPGEILTPAKHILPAISRLYGTLSNEWTHETFDSTARSIDQQSRQLGMVPRISDDTMNLYVNVLIQAATLAQLVGVAVETCFPDLRPDEVHFTTSSNGKRQRSHAPSSDAIRLAVEARKAFARGSNGA